MPLEPTRFDPSDLALSAYPHVFIRRVGLGTRRALECSERDRRARAEPGVPAAAST